MPVCSKCVGVNVCLRVTYVVWFFVCMFWYGSMCGYVVWGVFAAFVVLCLCVCVCLCVVSPILILLRLRAGRCVCVFEFEYLYVDV